MATSDYRLAALLSCELCLDRLADASAHDDALSAFERIIREESGERGGTVVKRVGETVLLSFSNAHSAVACAERTQQRCASPEDTGVSNGLLLRSGAHVGEVHFFENDAIGEVVAVTARLQALARPGALCLSESVHRFIAAKSEWSFTRVGTIPADGAVSEAVSAFECVIVNAADSESLEGSANLAAAESAFQVEEQRVKEHIFAEIKRAGRRLSVGEARERIAGSPAVIDRVLHELADKGFLRRVERGRPETDHAAAPEDAAGAAARGDATGTASRAGRRQRTPRRQRMHIPDRRGAGDEREDKEAEKQWDALLSPELDEEEDPTLIEEYREQTAEAADKAAAGFRGHLITYVGVNALLFMIYASTSAAGFPWFLIPLTAWGIGIATHAGSVVQRKRESRALYEMPRPTRKKLRLFRKLTKTRNSFSSHLVSTAATSVFLAVLNILLPPDFFWAIFPIGGMGIGVLSHLPSYSAKKRRLTAQLRAAGESHAGRDTADDASVAPYGSASASPDAAGPARYEADTLSNPGAEAQRLKREIMGQLARFEARTAPFGAEIEPVLDDYVSQVTQLSEKQREIAGIVNSIPVAALESDLQELSDKRRAAQDERLAAEYDRSIEQLLKQKRSFEELKNEQEVMALRLRSGLNTLTQLHIDLARMQSLSTGQSSSPSAEMLKEKSSELSSYLRDLEGGYAELG